MEEPSTPTTIANASSTAATMLSGDVDSLASTPFATAPSSPGHGGPFHSAPSSPMHFVSSSSTSHHHCFSDQPARPSSCSIEFDFTPRSAGDGSGLVGSMISADELFLDGRIRPMSLSTRPQVLAPLLDLEETEIGGEEGGDGNDRHIIGSFHRRSRSLSPLRTASFYWGENNDKAGKPTIHEEEAAGNGDDDEAVPGETTRTGNVYRSLKKWVFLKELLLYRSQSEGSNNRSYKKFWRRLSSAGSPVKEKITGEERRNDGWSWRGGEQKKGEETGKGKGKGKGKRRAGGQSAHERHYTEKRAEAEEMRKKTFLPYRQGLIGCLGFNSKSYGALNGFAKALNPVSSSSSSS